VSDYEPTPKVTELQDWEKELRAEAERLRGLDAREWTIHVEGERFNEYLRALNPPAKEPK